VVEDSVTARATDEEDGGEGEAAEVGRRRVKGPDVVTSEVDAR
jgi:hypothetical protein